MIYKIKTKDNKVYYVKQRDAVNLRKGDWFILFNNSRSTIYKVIDDQFKQRNGFDPSIVAEEYVVDTKEFLGNGPKKIVKKGTRTFSNDNLGIYIKAVFSSADEAINWLKRQLKLQN